MTEASDVTIYGRRLCKLHAARDYRKWKAMTTDADELGT